MKGAKTIGFDMYLEPHRSERSACPYHVRARALILCLILSTLCAGCAASNTQQSVENYRVLSQSKVRRDLLYQQTREHVLLASYAELQGEPARAARWFQQAWCLDPESLFLQEKMERYQAQALLTTPPRCYPSPRNRRTHPTTR